MPSSKNPALVVKPGSGRLAAGTVPASALTTPAGGSDAALEMHITDPVGAHAASAISTTPAGTQWRDGTGGTEIQAQARLDAVLSDLVSTTATHSGTDRIGSAALTSPVVGLTVSSGSAHQQMTTLMDARYHDFSNAGADGTRWLDHTANPKNSVADQLDKIVRDLKDTTALGGGGAAKIGSVKITRPGMPDISAGSIWDQLTALSDASNIRSAGYTVGSVTISTDSVSGQLQMLTSASNISLTGLPNWLTITNSDTDVQTQVSGIISTLTSRVSGNMGANQVGFRGLDTAHMSGAISVGAALRTIDTDAGFKGTSNTWTNTNTFQSGTSFQANATLASDSYLPFTGVSTNNNPANTTAVKNQLRAAAIPKAWAVATVVSGVPSLIDGFNIDTVSFYSPSTTTGADSTGLRFDFPTGGEMANGDYAVIATIAGYTGIVHLNANLSDTHIHNRTSDYFILQLATPGGAGIQWDDGTVNNVQVCVTVFGRQS